MNQNLLARLRRDTPECENLTHFGAAGSALRPRSVDRAMLETLALEVEMGGYEAMDFLAPRIAFFYEKLAEMLGCRPRNVAFMHHATHAFSAALSAIPLAAGDVILTTRNDYASGQIAFLSLKNRLGIEVILAEDAPEGGVDLADFELKMRRFRPKLVAVAHIPTNSGLVQPVEKIGEICRRAGVWFLVDACQSAGQMPLDVKKIGCDFLTASFRKWMRGPRGAGFLFVSDRALEAGLEPLFLDMAGAVWLGETYESQPSARRFEWHENAPSLQLAALAAIEYALDLGLENIQTRVRFLAEKVRRDFSKTENWQVFDRGVELSGIVTAASSTVDPHFLMQKLMSERIVCRLSTPVAAALDFREKGIAWALRVAPHVFNEEAEIDRFFDVLKS